MESTTAVSAWNEYLNSFIDELCETFPESPELIALTGLVETMIDDDEMSVLDKYYEELTPHIAKLADKDEGFFVSGQVDFLKRLGIAQYWTPDLEVETKEAIWNYLQTLLSMAQTIKSVPPEMLKLLEQCADKMTASIQRGEVNPDNMSLQDLGMTALQQMSGAGADGNVQSQGSALFGEDFSKFVGAQTAPAASSTASIPAASAGFDQLLGQFQNFQMGQQQQQTGTIPLPQQLHQNQTFSFASRPATGNLGNGVNLNQNGNANIWSQNRQGGASLFNMPFPQNQQAPPRK